MKSMFRSDVCNLIQADSYRWGVLALVEAIGPPGASIGAGFVRNLVWDHLHGRVSDCREEDVDVLYFDPERLDPAYEMEFEAILSAANPALSWEVRNQARMHTRNGDQPYRSVDDAMRHWPETATAIAASRHGTTCKLSAPCGLHDLTNMILRPTSLKDHKLKMFHDRVASKNWLSRWPMLTVHSC
jgi:uncharacterized protein